MIDPYKWDNAARDLTILDYCSDRVCAITSGTHDNPQTGTGTLFRHREYLFLVTCAHVWDSASHDPLTKVGIRHPIQNIPLSDFRLIHSIDQGNEDIALVQFPSTPDLSALKAWTVTALSNHLPKDKTSLVAVGFPFNLRVHKRPFVELMCHREITECVSVKSFGNRKLRNYEFCMSYSAKSPTARIIGTKSVPEVPGMSGGFAFSPEHYSRTNSKKLWTPAAGKIFGIITAWNQKDRYVCTSSKSVLKLFGK